MKDKLICPKCNKGILVFKNLKYKCDECTFIFPESKVNFNHEDMINLLSGYQTESKLFKPENSKRSIRIKYRLDLNELKLIPEYIKKKYK